MPLPKDSDTIDVACLGTNVGKEVHFSEGASGDALDHFLRSLGSSIAMDMLSQPPKDRREVAIGNTIPHIRHGNLHRIPFHCCVELAESVRREVPDATE